MLTIRPVTNNDLPILSEFWYDNMALLQQSNPRIRLLPDARSIWEKTVHTHVDDNKKIFLLAESESEILGCILGYIVPNQPALMPPEIGIIDMLILDIHTPQKQRGTGRKLFEALKSHFVEQNITQIQVRVSSQATVAQAFWLGIGAKKTDDIFWMTL